MTDVVLGIDFGTSGVRIAAASRDGAQLAMSVAPIVAPIQNTGRILQDPAVWWEALGQAFAGLELKGHRLLGISVDGTSGTILPVDGNGTPLGLASMYNDQADPADITRVGNVAPSETAARGGSSALARALPLLSLNPSRILHQADWIAGRLSGRFDVSDENNALKTGYDPVSRSWPSWIGETGMDTSLLPQVVPAGTAIGTILSDVAQEFGLPAGVKMVAGTTDGCAAFLASGASQAGDGVTSLGSTLTIKLLSDKPVFAPDYGIYSHRIGDQWLAGGASNTGGGVIGLYFSKDEIARLTTRLDPQHPTGLDYYPLAKPGERFPINDAALAPRLSPRPTEDRVFFQAMLEGIAAIETLAYKRLAELGASPLRTLRTVGGGAANAAWTAIRLNMLRAEPKAAASDHAAMGTARLAWRGIDHAD